MMQFVANDVFQYFGIKLFNCRGYQLRFQYYFDKCEHSFLQLFSNNFFDNNFRFQGFQWMMQFVTNNVFQYFGIKSLI